MAHRGWAGLLKSTCWLLQRAGLLLRRRTRLLIWYEAAPCAGATRHELLLCVSSAR